MTVYGTTYLSVVVTEDGVERPLVVGSRLRVQIGEDGGLVGRAGCNLLVGQVVEDDGVLRIEPREKTLMSCGDELDAQDDWFMGLLIRGMTAVVDGDVLTLTSGGTTITLLDRRIAEPDLPLDGTTWTVVSVVLGANGSSRHYGGVGPATLTINGVLAAGSTGSSPFTATVTRTDDTLAFTELVVTTTHPTDRAAELEQSVLENLGTTLTYEIESNHLELRGPTRATGLSLTAPRPDGNPRGTW